MFKPFLSSQTCYWVCARKAKEWRVLKFWQLLASDVLGFGFGFICCYCLCWGYQNNPDTKWSWGGINNTAECDSLRHLSVMQTWPETLSEQLLFYNPTQETTAKTNIKFHSFSKMLQILWLHLFCRLTLDKALDKNLQNYIYKITCCKMHEMLHVVYRSFESCKCWYEC